MFHDSCHGEMLEQVIGDRVTMEGFLEEGRCQPDLEELLRIRRSKDIPGVGRV